MRQGSKAELEMKRMLHAEDTVNAKVFRCEIFRYDAEKECIYLLLEEGELSEISLDALYECRIDEAEGKILCDGRIQERYRGEKGEILEFRIENGFYKINLKSVDK